MQSIISDYNKFKTRLESIKDFVFKFSNKNDSLIKAEENDFIIYAKQVERSLIFYNAIVISTYGSFENYIDDILRDYIYYFYNNNFDVIRNNKKILKKYKDGISEFLSAPHRFSDELLEKDVLNRYINFVYENNNGVYDLSFILRHKNNLNYNQLLDLFSVLDINLNQELFNDVELENYFLTIYEENDYNIKKARNIDALFYKLNNLVKIRNDVAHGWNEDERISISEIIDIIDFLILFAESLKKVLLINVVKHSQFEELEIINVFNNHIVCFNNNKHKISKGDYIYLKDMNNYICARVMSIEFEHNKIETISNLDSKNIGIQIDVPCKKSYKIIVE